MGIPHFENLSVNDFLFFIEHLDECSFTEKLDGSNMQFNSDGTASRSLKGGKSYKTPSDWPEYSWTNCFRQAHTALLQIKHLLPDDTYNLEIIHEHQPNVINYDKGVNKIVFLNSKNNSNFEEVIKTLENVKIPKRKYITNNGTSLILDENGFEEWSFHLVPEVDSSFKKLSKDQEIKIQLIKNYLAQNVLLEEDIDLTVFELMTMKFNKRHPKVPKEKWKNFKIGSKNSRDYSLIKFGIHLTEFKFPFVKKIQNMKSKFSDKGTGIEGVVIKHPTGLTTKIVGRMEFSLNNSKLWIHRESVRDKHIQLMKSKLCNVIGHPTLSNQGLVNKYLKDKDLSNFIPAIRYNRSLIIDIINKTDLDVREYLDFYKRTVMDTNEKDLLYFADSFLMLNKLRESIFCGNEIEFLKILTNYGE